MRVTVMPIVVSALGMVLKGFEKRLGIGNKWKNRDHPEHYFVKIGSNTQKCPRDLKRFDFT